MTMSQPQPFSALVKEAPIRTALATFSGLFAAEIIVTSRDEMESARDACQVKKLNRDTGRHEQSLDEAKFRAWLATRVASFDNLSLKKAMTLCGRSVPEDLADQADAPLACDPETVGTLLNMVAGLQMWLLNELGTIAITAARQEEAKTEN